MSYAYLAKCDLCGTEERCASQHSLPERWYRVTVFGGPSFDLCTPCTSKPMTVLMAKYEEWREQA